MLSIAKVANVAAIVSFIAATISATLFGHAGVELVAAGLALHVGGDLLESAVTE